MTIAKGVGTIIDQLRAAGATVTRISLGEVEETGMTVAELIEQLQWLPQGWRCRVKVRDTGDGLEEWGPLTGWVAGSGEVLLMCDEDEPGAAE